MRLETIDPIYAAIERYRAAVLGALPSGHPDKPGDHVNVID
jgi:hypothetical protein